MESRKNILIINDDIEMALQMKRWLPLGKYNVDYTLTGESGLQRLNEKFIDLILLDFNLKDDRGHARNALEYIPHINNFSQKTLIIVTSATEENVEKMVTGVPKTLHVDNTIWTRLESIVDDVLEKKNVKRGN